MEQQFLIQLVFNYEFVTYFFIFFLNNCNSHGQDIAFNIYSFVLISTIAIALHILFHISKDDLCNLWAMKENLNTHTHTQACCLSLAVSHRDSVCSVDLLCESHPKNKTLILFPTAVGELPAEKAYFTFTLLYLPKSRQQCKAKRLLMNPLWGGTADRPGLLLFLHWCCFCPVVRGWCSNNVMHYNILTCSTCAIKGPHHCLAFSCRRVVIQRIQ